MDPRARLGVYEITGLPRLEKPQQPSNDGAEGWAFGHSRPQRHAAAYPCPFNVRGVDRAPVRRRTFVALLRRDGPIDEWRLDPTDGLQPVPLTAHGIISGTGLPRRGSYHQPEDETVRNQQQRHKDRWNEVGRALQARIEPDGRSIAFVKAWSRSAAPTTLKTQTRTIPSGFLIVAHANSARIAVARSPYAAGPAKAAGRSGETTPGIRNVNPTNRKLWNRRIGRRASARRRLRNAGQTYCHVTIPLWTLANWPSARRVPRWQPSPLPRPW
jgi:hypothetical protein